MADSHKNFAYSLVATAPSPATSGTSLVVTAGQGALFPTPPFNATIWPIGSKPLSTNAEIVRVTNISTDTLTITRAQESSSARSVIIGDQIAATVTSATFSDYVAKAGDTMTGALTVNPSGAGTASQLIVTDTASNPGITLNGNGTTGALFLSGSGQLQTSGLFWSIRASSGVEGIGVATSGDTVRRFGIFTDGTLKFSSGSATADTTITRNTTGGLNVTNTTGTVASPSNYVLRISPSGQTSSSVSTGGALFISNHNNFGSALNVYTDTTSTITPLSVTANASTSVQGVNPISTYAFDWGDSNTTSAQASPTANHTYAADGTYTVTVTVTDTLGNTSTNTAPITLATPTAPTASLTLTPGASNVSHTITASGAASTQGTNPVATYTFGWGDGNTTGPQTTSSATHAYASAATYTVTLTVTASDGTTSTTTQSIVISAATANPTASLTAAATAQNTSTLNQVQINSQAFNSIGQQFKYSGTSHAVSISSTSIGTNAQALNIVSTNPNDTTLGVNGSELSKGTIKVVHTGTGADTSASALSLRANGVGTAAQGIFFDAENGGTTGALQKFRNNGVDKWVINSSGSVTTGVWTGTAIAIASGGTGQTSASAAFNVLSPNTTLGDITYGNGVNSSTRLAGNVTAAKQFLTQTGTGSVSAAPGWGAIAAADLPTGTTGAQGALQLDSAVPAAPSTTFTGAAGSTGKAADSGHIHERHEFNPKDVSLLAWAYDPVMAANSTALATAGTVYVIKVHCPVAISVTNIIMQVVTQGSSLTTGQCFAGLYQSGSLLGTTADQASAWGTTGGKTMAISGGAVNVAAGDVYIAAFFNGSTGPAFSRTANISGINGGLAAASSRFGTADTSRTTTMPGTLGTVAALSISYWGALS